MSGTSQWLSRLSAARAFFAGAAFLAGASASAAAADVYEDVALAIPRVSPRQGGVSLPQPLPPSEVARLRRVFAAQAAADIPEALAQSAKGSNNLLLGHVLADRYLGPCGLDPVAPDEQLRAWLSRYGDLPDAPALHALLLSMMPKSASPPLAPPSLRPMLATAVPSDDVEPALRLMPRSPALDRSIHEPARAGQHERALRLIAHTKGLDPLYAALLRAEVAQILFFQGRDNEALTLAEAANRQAHGRLGLAPFVAGLAAWRLERTDHAQAMFEAAYAASLTSPGRRSAAAFWAARAALRGRNPGAYGPWMQRAATSPRSFYGLLARRALGQGIVTADPTASWTLGEADIDAVAGTDSGMRAFGLLQIGQTERAGAELRRLWAETQEQPGFSRAILLVARAAGLKALANQMADAILPQDSLYLRLPTTRLRPRGGFRVDPALVYAMTRLESNFDPKAVSRAGARGLMQLMPGTAGFVLGGPAVNGHTMHVGAQLLRDPATNLDVAQRYLLQMAQYDTVQSDLIRLLASYNSGPASYARWSADLNHKGDPLLFIESVPNEETRAYIPRVLTYTWLYAAQLHLPTPSLDELAAGTWPRFYVNASRPDLVIARIH